jgi:hypothetical protein
MEGATSPGHSFRHLSDSVAPNCNWGLGVKTFAIQRASVGRRVGSKAHGFNTQSEEEKTYLKIKEEKTFIFFLKKTYMTVVQPLFPSN